MEQGKPVEPHPAGRKEITALERRASAGALPRFDPTKRRRKLVWRTLEPTTTTPTRPVSLKPQHAFQMRKQHLGTTSCPPASSLDRRRLAAIGSRQRNRPGYTLTSGSGCPARLQRIWECRDHDRPASSYYTASARDSSDWDVWAFKAKLHLQSGTRCFGPEVCTAKQGVLPRAGYLHQSPRKLGGHICAALEVRIARMSNALQ